MFGNPPLGHPWKNMDLAQQGVGSDNANYPLWEDTEGLLVDAREDGFYKQRQQWRL